MLIKSYFSYVFFLKSCTLYLHSVLQLAWLKNKLAHCILDNLCISKSVNISDVFSIWSADYVSLQSPSLHTCTTIVAHLVAVNTHRARVTQLNTNKTQGAVDHHKLLLCGSAGGYSCLLYYYKWDHKGGKVLSISLIFAKMKGYVCFKDKIWTLFLDQLQEAEVHLSRDIRIFMLTWSNRESLY